MTSTIIDYKINDFKKGVYQTKERGSAEEAIIKTAETIKNLKKSWEEDLFKKKITITSIQIFYSKDKE